MDTLQWQVLKAIQDEFGNQVSINFKDERGDGKHFYLDIMSEKFVWKSRIEQSKMVYAVLDNFMKTWSIHALRMKCRIPNN